MGDEKEISFPDGGMVASDSGMSTYSCSKSDYHYLAPKVKRLEAENTALKAKLDRLVKSAQALYDELDKFHVYERGEVIPLMDNLKSALAEAEKP